MSPLVQGLTRLSSLNLSQNHLTSIEGVAECRNLTELNLSMNKISFIQNLSALSSLTKLILYGNRISVLEGLQGLPALRYSFLYSLVDVESMSHAHPKLKGPCWLVSGYCMCNVTSLLTQLKSCSCPS